MLDTDAQFTIEGYAITVATYSTCLPCLAEAAKEDGCGIVINDQDKRILVINYIPVDKHRCDFIDEEGHAK